MKQALMITTGTEYTVGATQQLTLSIQWVLLRIFLHPFTLTTFYQPHLTDEERK